MEKKHLQRKKQATIKEAQPYSGWGGGGGTKRHSTPSADWCKISSLYLVPVANH